MLLGVWQVSLIATKYETPNGRNEPLVVAAVSGVLIRTDGHTGIFTIAPPDNGALRIAAAADWGTGTLEAETVAENMSSSSPHYALHLGDVYYMGEAPEVDARWKVPCRVPSQSSSP